MERFFEGLEDGFLSSLADILRGVKNRKKKKKKF